MNRPRRHPLTLSDGGLVRETWPEGWCRRSVPDGRSEFMRHWYPRGGRLPLCCVRAGPWALTREAYWAVYAENAGGDADRHWCGLCRQHVTRLRAASQGADMQGGEDA